MVINICRVILRLAPVVLLWLATTTAQARFLQADPVGYGPDLDLYSYVGNDPTDKTDPSGPQPPLTVEGAEALQNGPSATPDQLDAAGTALQAAGAFPEVATRELELGGLALRALAGSERAAAQLKANVAKGAAGEAKTATKLGDKVAGKQVTFKTNDGTRTRTDFVTRDRGVVETKTGQSELRPGQQKLHDDINSGRPVTPVGQNAANAGLTPGEPTTLYSR